MLISLQDLILFLFDLFLSILCSSELLNNILVLPFCLCFSKLANRLNVGKTKINVLLNKRGFSLSVFVFKGDAAGMDNFGDFLSFVNFRLKTL